MNQFVVLVKTFVSASLRGRGPREREAAVGAGDGRRGPSRTKLQHSIAIPDAEMNPIEKIFSKLKPGPRKAVE